MRKTGAQSAQKVLILLELLRDAGEWIRITDLAESSGMSKTVVHRLLSELVSRGLAERDPEARMYRLGAGVLSYGAAILKRTTFLDVAAPIARTLRDDWFETVTVHVRSGDDRVVIYEAEGLYELRRHAGLGHRVPLQASASGRVIMAHMSGDEVERLLSRPVPVLNSPAQATPASLRQQFAAIRQQGYAVTRSQAILGVTAIAVPVLGFGGHPQGSIAISGPSTRLEELPDGMVESIVAAADEASLALGFADGVRSRGLAEALPVPVP